MQFIASFGLQGRTTRESFAVNDLLMYTHEHTRQFPFDRYHFPAELQSNTGKSSLGIEAQPGY
jgi:hypothetical protein